MLPVRSDYLNQAENLRKNYSTVSMKQDLPWIPRGASRLALEPCAVLPVLHVRNSFSGNFSNFTYPGGQLCPNCSSRFVTFSTLLKEFGHIVSKY